MPYTLISPGTAPPNEGGSDSAFVDAAEGEISRGRSIAVTILEVFLKVLTFLPRCDLQRRVAKALSSAQFVVETVVSARECLQLTRFAPYEGVLVDSDS